MARCVRVPKSSAETVRSELENEGSLDHGFRIASDGDSVLIPVTEGYSGLPTEDADLLPRNDRSGDYRTVIDVPDDVRPLLPSSFDVIGDIAVIKVPADIADFSGRIGEALMKASPNIRAVFHDAGVKGEFRVRELTRIAGTGDACTMHKESGTRIMTDPSKVYFNPRLASERARVAQLVRPGETIIDMFAGVAPFGCVICRNASPRKVYSIDLNPECEHFARRNASLNKTDLIEPITGDAREIIRDLPDADRIIMNLPQMADEFLPDALAHIKPTGTVHMHRVLERDGTQEFADGLVRKMGSAGTPIRIESVIELKNYSPTKGVYVFDIRPL